MFDLEEDEHDDCHQYLLTIVARGTAIITEIYRLVELLPEPLQSQCHHKNTVFNFNQAKPVLKEIIFDFSYFKNAEAIEAKIELDPDLKRIDEKFCQDYGEVLTRFYQTFEAVQRHTSDLNNFTADLANGLYIGQSLDELLADHENRQLVCEAYYQIGCMLLLIDKSFEGKLRERLIVSYYRYSAFRSSPDANLDDTCNLMRATGFKCDQQQSGPAELSDNADRSRKDRRQTYRPSGYPEDYLARACCDQSVISSLISKLQTIDIYNQTVTVFPNPDHRSNALAQQAAILYVLLYFCPDILRTQKSRMREIADKFFPDNWVVHIFISESVNLIEMWEPYQAARESLLQIYDIESVRSLSSQMALRFDRNAKQLVEYLREGWLSEETFVEHSGRILNCIRDSNVVLRWLLLHSKAQSCWFTERLAKSLLSEVLTCRPDSRGLCEFFYNLCILENKVALLYDRAYKLKMTNIREQKSRAIDMLGELISIFDDTKPMRWVKVGVNHGLAKILSGVKSQLNALDLDEASSSGRETIVRMVNRIESARNSYSDGKSLQVVQLFVDTKDRLVKLLRYLDLGPNFKTVLQSVGDFAYGWPIVHEVFTEPIQEIIRDNPENLYTFEAVIIKLTSALESQLVRLQQVGAEADLISVSQYYSSKLMSHVKDVLQIIPAAIFELIQSIVSIRTSKDRQALGSIPSRINIDQLRQYALIDQRANIVQTTSVISHYARGIMAMPKTPIGLVRVDSKKMFEEGIKRELASSITSQIIDSLGTRTTLITASSTQLQLSKDLEKRLGRLESVLTSYKQSLEYIQDFLFIYGIKMWRSELSRIVRESVEKAVSTLSRNNHLNSDSFGLIAENQSTRASTIKERFSTITAAKIRTAFMGHSDLVQGDNNQGQNGFIFVLALLQDILKITDPHETVYDEQAGIWYDKLHHQQVFEPITTFKLIGSSLGVTGLNGLDELCSTMIMQELEQLNSIMCDSKQPAQSGLNRKLAFVNILEALNQVRHDEWFLVEIDNEPKLKRLMLSIFLGSLNLNRTSPSSSASTDQRFINHLLTIGQLQIIRMSIQCVLSANCRFEAKHLHGCLEGLNSALLATIRQGKGSPNQQKAKLAVGRSRTSLDGFSSAKPDEDNTLDETNARSSSDKLDESQLIFTLANHLEWVGMSDPMGKIYTLSLDRNRPIFNNQQLIVGDANDPTRSHGYKNRRAIYHSILEHSSKLCCSDSIIDGAPLLAKRSSSDKLQNKVDEQPLYFGIITLLNHYEPNLVV